MGLHCSEICLCSGGLEGIWTEDWDDVPIFHPNACSPLFGGLEVVREFYIAQFASKTKLFCFLETMFPFNDFTLFSLKLCAQISNFERLFFLGAMDKFHSIPPPKATGEASFGPGFGQGRSSIPARGVGGKADRQQQPGVGGSSAVEANVSHIENKKWLVEPSIPDKPGATLPYPTSDICRNMNRPRCTAVQQGDEEIIILYGYFENKQENISNFYGPARVGKSQIPPFYGEQAYISLRACPEECWDRSNWGKKHNEYVYGRDLLFYRMKIPKASYKWMYQQKLIKELGKSGGKQWVHLQRDTNVKSKCTCCNTSA